MSERLCKALEYALTVTFEQSEAAPKPSAKVHKLEQRLSDDVINAILADYEGGLRGSGLARKYELHESSLRGLITRHGLKPDNGVPGAALSRDEISKAVELYESGLSIKDVAQGLGRAQASIQKYLAQLGVELRPPTRRLKLAAEEVDQAVSSYESGESLVQISSGLPVGAEAVRRALRARGVVMRPAGAKPS